MAGRDSFDSSVRRDLNAAKDRLNDRAPRRALVGAAGGEDLSGFSRGRNLARRVDPEVAQREATAFEFPPDNELALVVVTTPLTGGRNTPVQRDKFFRRLLRSLYAPPRDVDIALTVGLAVAVHLNLLNREP